MDVVSSQDFDTMINMLKKLKENMNKGEEGCEFHQISESVKKNHSKTEKYKI